MFAIVRGIESRDTSRVCLVPSHAYPTGKCRQGGPFSSVGLGTW
jgi:hypothetical protein